MRISKLASWVIIMTGIIALLVYGKNLLIPFVIAWLVWYIIVSLSRSISRLSFAKRYFPNWLNLTISTFFIIGIMVFVGELIANSASAMANTIPKYENRFNRITQDILAIVGVDNLPNFSSLFEDFDFNNIISSLLNTFSSMASNAMLILIYLLFIFTEQAVFHQKIKALFPDSEQFEHFYEVLERVNEAIVKYLSVKSLVSILTALVSYVIMYFVGVDFAIFWAFLIFLLNFIPNIGSIIATLFPALLTLVQFDNYTPFFIILIGVGTVQLLVGNVMEPRLMGDSLNISPLVVIIALSVWGALWGITGMVLSVPITVIMIIIMAQFKETRPVAILLSLKGVVPSINGELEMSANQAQEEEPQNQ